MTATLTSSDGKGYNHPTPSQKASQRGDMEASHSRPPFLLTPHNHLEFLRRFIISRDDVYARQTHDGRYCKVSKKLTDAALLRHLQHKITLGCYNSFADSTIKYATIDLDNHEGAEIIPDHIVKQQFRKVITTLREFGIPYSMVESSPGCYHVNTYFYPPAKTSEAYDFIRFVTDNAGLVDAEVFPKQREIPEGDYGNLIRLDFSKHQKKGTSSYFINEDFDHIETAEVRTIDITGFEYTPTQPQSKHIPEPSTIVPSSTGVQNSTGRYDGGVPFCLERVLIDRVQLTGGGGHYARIAIVCAYRDIGLGSEAIEKMFTGQDDHDEGETRKQVRSVLKKEGGYSYSCPTLCAKCGKFVHPYCEHCPRAKGLSRMPSNNNTTGGL